MKLHKFKKINATYLLISICITVFLVELFYNYFLGDAALQSLFYTYGFSLDNMIAGKIWTPLTSIFLHANPEHIMLNMIALFFFGSVLENEIGWKKVILIFFVAAMVGNLAVVVANLVGIMPAAIPVVGASGAIFGLLGAAMLIKPLEFVFFPYLVPIPLLLVALIYIFFNIAEFIVVLVSGGVTNVSYVSHIGGLASGMLFGFKQEGKKKSLIVLIAILIILILIPFIWEILKHLEITNYTSFISTVFK